MVNEEEELFNISFHSMGCEAIEFQAYAYNIYELEMFIKQHGLSSDLFNIKMSRKDKFDDSLIIEPFKFKSNSSGELFTVFTTKNIVQEAIESVCRELSESLIMGDPITRTDIQLIDEITTLIHDLDHAYVLDFAEMDQDETMLIHDNFDKLKFNGDEWVCTSFDDSYIYESMLQSMDHPEEVLSITIEGYVTYFTNILTDSY